MLASLQLDEDDFDDIVAKLSSIVDFDDVVPMAHPLNQVQRLRPDVVTQANERDAFQANAPATQDGFYLVPKVIE
jgi:aspartyl-tRNA(Asn)/glutamyl-tRNA(Gln) amidotransferase subunit C